MEKYQSNGFKSSALIIDTEMLKLPNKFRSEIKENFIKLDDDFLNEEGIDVFLSSSLTPISTDFYKFLKEQNPEYYGFSNGYDELGNRLDLIKYFKSTGEENEII